MKKNVLFYIMDAVSFDQFNKASTPFIELNAHRIQKSYTGGTWTLPSMKSIVHGIIPQTDDISLYKFKRPWMLPEPKCYKREGYNTYALSGNPLFSERTFPCAGFDEFIVEKDDIKKSGENIVSKFLDIYEEPFFCIMLLIDTHRPYNGIEDEELTLKEMKKNQRDAITKLDKELERLYNDFSNNTEILVFADHGELFRKDKYGTHDPRATNISGTGDPSCNNETSLLEVFTALIRKKVS